MSLSPDLSALRRLGLSAAVLQRALECVPPAGGRLARVTEIQRDHAQVHDGHGAGPACLWPTLRLRLQIADDALVVGDWVWLRDGDAGAPAWIVARVPPTGRIGRRDVSGGRQPLVANVDTAVLVMGLDGDFNLRRLDRFLVLAHTGGVDAVVALTKADRCADPAAAIARVQAHIGGDRPVRALDARDAEAAVAALAPWLGCGRTLVLLGASGTGKSTLTQALTGRARATRGVRGGDDRGLHTTTCRSLQPTPGGACVIDTPGLRQLWLDADARQLGEAFGEIGVWAAACRFRDCRHAEEPGCAVRERLAPARLQSYHKLLREAQWAADDSPQVRRALRAQWKQRSRATRAAQRRPPE